MVCKLQLEIMSCVVYAPSLHYNIYAVNNSISSTCECVLLDDENFVISHTDIEERTGTRVVLSALSFMRSLKHYCQLFIRICFLLLLLGDVFWGFLTGGGEQTWKLPTVVYYIKQNPKGDRCQAFRKHQMGWDLHLGIRQGGVRGMRFREDLMLYVRT